MEEPTPAQYQPALTLWGHLWRLVLMVAITATVWSLQLTKEWRDNLGLFMLDLAFGLLAFVVVHFRRRAPLAVAIVVTLCGLVSGISAGPGLLAAVSLATRRKLPEIITIGILGVATAQTFRTWQPQMQEDTGPYWLDLTLNTVVTIAVLLWGMYLGSRRELLWTLKHRAETAEAEQDFRVTQARSNERARIAREMHDVLAHRISQISMQAGALAYRSDLDADQLREHSATLQTMANAALTDLRGVLGVLRDPETGERAEAPQPTYADLPELVDQARSTGLRIEFDDLLADLPEGPPAVVGRTLYRIVQEGITNAAKHAPGALLRIEVSGNPEAGIEISLRNSIGFGLPATPGAGLGLIGLAERAKLRGGRLEGRRDGSTFVLHGWIPWAA